jgi:hypothetical protein
VQSEKVRGSSKQKILCHNIIKMICFRIVKGQPTNSLFILVVYTLGKKAQRNHEISTV